MKTKVIKDYSALKGFLEQTLKDSMHVKTRINLLTQPLIMCGELMDINYQAGALIEDLCRINKELPKIYKHDKERADFTEHEFITKVQKFITDKTQALTAVNEEMTAYHARHVTQDQKEITETLAAFEGYRAEFLQAQNEIEKQLSKKSWALAALRLASLPDYPVESMGYYDNSTTKRFVPLDDKFIKAGHRLQEMEQWRATQIARIPIKVYSRALIKVKEAQIAANQDEINELSAQLQEKASRTDDAWLARAETLTGEIKQMAFNSNKIFHEITLLEQKIKSPAPRNHN